MAKVDIPYYYKSLNWNNFVAKFPPPAEFESSIYRWNRDQIRQLQETRFLEAMEIGWGNAFYQRIWKQAGLEPRDIRGLDDLHKLPIVSSEDFKVEIEDAPPWGLHQGVTPDDARHKPLKIQTSGGTTGKPRPTFFGPIEWELNGMSAARALFIQGARPGDVMQIPMTCYTGNAGWSYYLACHNWMGIVPLTTGAGSVTPSRRQLEFARDWGTNLWLAGAYHVQLAKTAQEELGFDVRDLNTRFLHAFIGADESGEFRTALEDLWGCDVYDNYGTHEIGLPAFECREKSGLHLQEDLGYTEIIDSQTGQPVDAASGEIGDFVYTSFYRQHPPLIRYNLKDRTRFVDHGERCACGSYLLRRDHHLGRSDDMVKLRATNVYPEACQDAVNSDPRTTGEYLCVVDDVKDEMGVRLSEEMTVKVEYRDANLDKQDFKRVLETRLKADLGVRVAVEPVSAGSLAEYTSVDGSEIKKRRLLDLRATQHDSKNS